MLKSLTKSPAACYVLKTFYVFEFGYTYNVKKKKQNPTTDSFNPKLMAILHYNAIMYMLVGTRRNIQAELSTSKPQRCQNQITHMKVQSTVFSLEGLVQVSSLLSTNHKRSFQSHARVQISIRVGTEQKQTERNSQQTRCNAAGCVDD